MSHFVNKKEFFKFQFVDFQNSTNLLIFKIFDNKTFIFLTQIQNLKILIAEPKSFFSIDLI